MAQIVGMRGPHEYQDPEVFTVPKIDLITPSVSGSVVVAVSWGSMSRNLQKQCLPALFKGASEPLHRYVESSGPAVGYSPRGECAEL